MTIDILLLEGVHESALPILQAIPGARVTRLAHAPGADELAARLARVQILGLRSRTRLSAQVLEAAPVLRAVGAYCTGTNNIDLEAASAHGVAVFNGPFSNTRSVAELVIGHAIHLLRRIPERHAALRQGRWLKDAKGSNELRGKTLGVVGYGKIGSQTALLAEAMGMRVVFHDVQARLPLGNARQAASLGVLLAEADVVTLHVPQTPQTHQLMDATALAAMKPGAVLINLARGHAVDLAALHQALLSGHLRGAALDVFADEPASADQPFVTPLQALDNVILTPHIGGSTIEAQRNLGVEVSEKLRDHLVAGEVRGSVNLPELSVGPLAGGARLMHLHRDQPGVLSRLTAELAGAGLNLTRQQLATANGLGIVVTDVDRLPGLETLAALWRIEGTLRVATALSGDAADRPMPAVVGAG